METEQSRKRRRYSGEVKAQILAECAAAGASVARVAMAHGISANILHGWRRFIREADLVVVRPAFVPVAVAPPAQAPSGERGIELELRCGPVTIKLVWPTTSAADLAAVTGELLR